MAKCSQRQEFCVNIDMKLSVWAKNNGLSYKTAWNLFQKGNLPVKATQLATGTIIVEENPACFCPHCGKEIK